MRVGGDILGVYTGIKPEVWSTENGSYGAQRVAFFGAGEIHRKEDVCSELPKVAICYFFVFFNKKLVNKIKPNMLL